MKPSSQDGGSKAGHPIAQEKPAATSAERAAAEAKLSQIPIFMLPSIPARIEGMPRALPRARGPALATAIRLAEAAVESAKARGGRVSVLVTDSVGVPVVMLSGDGAGERSQLIASTKAHLAVLYRMPSGEVEKMAADDPRLRAEIKANPNIGVARGGGFPLMLGEELIGAIAVSGFTEFDEACAQDAIAAVPLSREVV